MIQFLWKLYHLASPFDFRHLNRCIAILTMVLICISLMVNTEKAMAPHSSTLAWKLPWTEEPGNVNFLYAYLPSVYLLHSICQQIWKTQHWPQDWKRSVFIPIPKKSNAKECSNYHTIALISHSSKVMFKILQARLQQYVNSELPEFKLVLEKAEEPEIKLPTSAGSSKKQESSRKNIYFCFIDYAKALTVWITINCGKFFKRWEYQTA